MSSFRVGLSAGFFGPDGTPTYADFDLAPLRAAPGVEVVRMANGPVLAPADVASLDALILLGEGFGPASADPGGRLALVARFGVGFDKVDVEACTRADIALTVTPDAVRRPMAVAIVTMLLALAGRLFVKDRLTREGPAGWTKRGGHMGVGLVGRTLGIVGLGNIGAELVRMVQPFQMKLIAADPVVPREAAWAMGVEPVALDELFARSDFVSVTCPLSEATRGLVSARRIAAMKPTAFLINAARGPIVDQPALVAALRGRRIAGAALDVFDPEPPPLGDPVLALDNAILAPHALGWTDQLFASMGAETVAASLAVRRGEAPPNVVNRPVLDRPGFRAKLARHRAG